MKTLRSGSTLCAALLLASLSSARAQSTPLNIARDLRNTSWQLVKFQGSDDTTLTPSDKANYTIAFQNDGTVNARIDCNRGHSTWKSTGPNQLTLGPLALTRAMCPPAPLNDRLPKDWANVRSYVIKDGHLFLSLIADGGLYEFEPATPASEPHYHNVKTIALENSDWKLIWLGDSPVNSASQRQQPHLLFDSNSHRVSGSGGCNQLTGGYQLTGNELKFGQLASTMMACSQGMETEQALRHMLPNVATWKITGQELELYDSSGKTLARLTPIAASPTT